MDVSRANLYKSNMSQIRSYNLYGEQGDLPDVVHCETIQTRSLVHNWEFRPHRHDRLHQVLLLDQGGGTATLDGTQHALTPGLFVNVPLGVVHGFTFQPQTQGWVVTLATELVQQDLQRSPDLRPLLQTPTIAAFDPEIRQTIRQIFAEHAGRSFARAHVLRALSALLIGLVARRIAAQSEHGQGPTHALHHRFEALLQAHATQHLSVADYAARLGVTPTHLSRVLRDSTGQSALAVIQAHLMREARRNLAFSNLPVSEIAYQLGYVDPAYFSRVFKRATGVSPRAFRQTLSA